MATAYKPPQGGKGADEEAVRVHRIRITLTSKNVVNLEKGALIYASLLHARPAVLATVERPWRVAGDSLFGGGSAALGELRCFNELSHTVCQSRRKLFV